MPPKAAKKNDDQLREIPLTNGGVALVSPRDYRTIAAFKWFRHSAGYAARMVTVAKNKQLCILMHRYLMEPPDDMVVDHINGDPLDNRRTNLRVVTWAENRVNSRRDKRAAS